MSNSGHERVVRPTFRCLLDDLVHDVGPDELRTALRTLSDDQDADPSYLLPCALTDVDHPVLDKANLLVSEDAAHREPIKSITDRDAVKVKTGDRRGAIWQDASGTWWLLAGGHRKDDGPADFYSRLERFKRGDSSPIAPTEADARYLRLESAFLAELATERDVHRRVLETVFSAARTLGSVIQVQAFGAAVSVRIDSDDGGLAVVEVSWEFGSYQEADRFPHDVLAMVPGLESTELWEYLPPRRDEDAPYTWFAYVPDEWVEHLATSIEIDDLIDEHWVPPAPASDGSEHFSHRASSRVVTLAYVTGIEIVGLCGARIVAHRDHERFPRCPRCEESLALLRELRPPEPR